MSDTERYRAMDDEALAAEQERLAMERTSIRLSQLALQAEIDVRIGLRGMTPAARKLILSGRSTPEGTT